MEYIENIIAILAFDIMGLTFIIGIYGFFWIIRRITLFTFRTILNVFFWKFF